MKRTNAKPATVWIVAYMDGRAYDVGTGLGHAAYVQRSDATYVCRRIGEGTRPVALTGPLPLLRSLGLDVVEHRRRSR